MMAVLYFVFWCTFTLGAYPQAWIEQGVNALCEWLSDSLPLHGGDGGGRWFYGLLIDGVLQGVGAVLAFLPNIIILFFFISLMEDSGYMAREAFIMDTIMHRVGLHGRSFVPMLMGFGCNVPAIMAARDIQNPKDRVLTMLMVPFMSCSARLPVYMLFVDTFFVNYKALVMISLYAIGICLSVLFAVVMKKTPWFRQDDDDSVNELPEFRLPKARATAAHIWERVADYLQKICTVILWASIIIWALEYFPSQDLNDLEHSYLASIGKAVSPLLEPLGFDWKMSVCLLTGLPAKEAIVSTLAILYGGDIATAGFTPLTAFSFLLFVLLYFPCIATIAAIKHETASWRWALTAAIYTTAIAWIVSAVFTQVGLLIGIG
jgi:ferrous iron transport protein B